MMVVASQLALFILSYKIYRKEKYTAVCNNYAKFIKNDNLVNVGVKLRFVLSRGGGADIAFTRSWVMGTESEVTLTKLSASYAITNNLRFSTELGQQKSSRRKERQIAFLLEWMP